MPDTKGIGTFINDEHELVTDSIDLFSIPQAEVSVVHGKDVIFFPSSNFNADGNFEFHLANDSNEFTMLDRTTIYGEAEVVKKDGSAITAADKVSCANFLPHCLWSSFEVKLNGMEVNDHSTAKYPYKAFIESHLTYDTNIKETTLAATEMYLKDTLKEEKDYATGIAKAESGISKRSGLITGKKFYFDFVPHVDFLQSKKFLLPGVEMHIKMNRGKDGFCLMHGGAEDDYKVKFHKMYLCTRKVTLDPQVAAKIEAHLAKVPTVYPITQSTVKTHMLTTGTQTTYLSQVVRGKLPSRMIFCIVDADQIESNPGTNPFYFNNCGVNYLNVLVNGEPIHATAIDPDWDKGRYLREYRWFLNNIGLKNNLTNGITLEEFGTNSCFFAYDLSPDQCNGYYKHGLEHGTIDIHLGFKKALAKNHQLLLYGCYDEQVLIDKNRQVTVVR